MPLAVRTSVEQGTFARVLGANHFTAVHHTAERENLIIYKHGQVVEGRRWRHAFSVAERPRKGVRVEVVNVVEGRVPVVKRSAAEDVDAIVDGLARSQHGDEDY